MKQFAKENGITPTEEPPPIHLLDERRIQLHPTPEKPVPVFCLAGKGIATAGNLIVVQSQAKTGKSAVVGAMLASIMVDPAGMFIDYVEEPDCLGFTSSRPDGKAVILFDTEQSEYDAWRLIQRACMRAEVTELPGWMRAYRLLDVPTNLRLKLLWAEAERANAECGGVHVILIDGIADLCVDPNDSAEAFGLVEELHLIAGKHNCPIVVVIHENPSSQDAKTRGHLGSQLSRKAETNLRLLRADKDGATEIYTEVSRSCFIAKGQGVLFRFNALLEYHTTVERETAQGKDAAKVKELREVLAEIFGNEERLSWSEMKERICSVMGVSKSTAERRREEFMQLKMILKDDSGHYTRSQEEEQ